MDGKGKRHDREHLFCQCELLHIHHDGSYFTFKSNFYQLNISGIFSRYMRLYTYISYPLNLAQQNNLAIKLRLNNMLKSSAAITAKVIQDSAHYCVWHYILVMN